MSREKMNVVTEKVLGCTVCLLKQLMDVYFGATVEVGISGCIERNACVNQHTIIDHKFIALNF